VDVSVRGVIGLRKKRLKNEEKKILITIRFKKILGCIV